MELLLLKKLFLALSALVALMTGQETKLGGATKTDIISNIDTTESAELSEKGKYKHISKTEIIAEYPTAVRVDEWVRGNNEARGYTIYLEHYENQQIFNATTSQMETVSVLVKEVIQK